MSAYLSDRVLMVDIEKKTEPAISQMTEHADLPMDIVIVSYNSRELLRACLASIELERPREVVVIDNASADGSDEMVRQEFPSVRMMTSEKNAGYGAAANLAIASCSSKYVLLLNSDTMLQPGGLQALHEYLHQHPQVAIVGPQLLNPDGTTQTSCFRFPTPLQTFLRETSLSRYLHHFSKALSSSSNYELDHNAQAVPWVLGAALVIRRHAFDAVGGFDESFFMYFEEVDLCYRLHKSGWQTHFAPVASVTHIGGASTKHHRAAMVQQLYKSLCHFYRKHYSAMQRVQLRWIMTYLMLRNIAKDGVNSYRASTNTAATDLSVWRSILFNIWSAHGWLSA